jgi:hypothetical protein
MPPKKIIIYTARHLPRTQAGDIDWTLLLKFESNASQHEPERKIAKKSIVRIWKTAMTLSDAAKTKVVTRARAFMVSFLPIIGRAAAAATAPSPKEPRSRPYSPMLLTLTQTPYLNSPN